MKQNSEKFFSAKNMAFIALFAAMLCVISPFSIVLPGTVPLSLGTFAVYLSGAMLGAKRSTLAVTVYILIGAVGLPVFTGFTGGLAKLLGVTGGYLIGYIPLAFLSGLFTDKNSKMTAVGMVLGTAVLYLFGTVWFIIFTSSTLEAALMSCVVPFLIGDAIKIAAATAISIPVRQRLSRYFK